MNKKTKELIAAEAEATAREVVRKELNSYFTKREVTLEVKQQIQDAINDLKDAYVERERTRDEVMRQIQGTVEQITQTYIDQAVERYANQVKDELLVELARQAIFGTNRLEK